MSTNRWFILGLLFLARTVMAGQFQSVGALGPVLVRELGVDYAAIGTLIGLYMLPGIVIALPGGLLGQRFGAKPVVIAGLLLMASGGLLMGGSASFLPLAAGRLLSGIGAVLLNVLLTKMVADWFAGRGIATAMSILISSWPLGIALGLILFPPLSTMGGWGSVMLAMAGLALASLVLIAAFYRDPPSFPAAAPGKLHFNLSGREWRLVSIASLIWTAYNVGYIVLAGFAPEFFTTRGLSLEEASSIVSILGWSLIPMVPASGHLAERLRRPTLFMAGGFAVVAVALALLPLVSGAIADFVLVAVALGLPPGLVMALPAGALRPEARSVGMGVFYSWYYAGMALLPAIAGFYRDLAGSPAAPILFSSAMMLLGLMGLMLFRLVERPPAATA